MAAGQSQLERAICEIKRGADVSQLEDEYKISTRERIIKEVKVPEMTIPTDDVFFSRTEEGKPDVEFLKNHFYRQGRIKEEHALYIIDKATQLLCTEPNVLAVDAPVTVCGNINGQYYDLMRLFELGGHPTVTRYLFLGDYVNQGYFGIECLLYLWTLKIWYPNSFFLLRGHHECRRLTEYLTFMMECKLKYSERVFEACLESFCALPLVAIVAKRHFCVHGGVSPELHVINDIQYLNRFREPPASGLMCDILWSDPIEDFGQEHIREKFVHNHVRDCSYFYTYKAVCDFLGRNRLSSIIRAHQLQDSGYRLYRNSRNEEFPSVTTLFSAPNYRNVHRNMGAVLKCGHRIFGVQPFHPMPHPYQIPRFLDIFSLSIPFICEKVLDMLAAMLYIDSLELKESIEKSDLVPVDHNKAERLEMLQNKILAARCISYMFSIFDMETKHESELRNFLRSSRLMYGVLSLHPEDIKKAIEVFDITPNTKGSAGEKAASVTAGAIPMTRFRRTKEGGESEAAEAKSLNTELQDSGAEVRSSEVEASEKEDNQSGPSLHETEPQANRVTPEIQDIQKQLREKEKCLQIREAEVQDVETVLRVKESDLRVREADVKDVEKVFRVKERDLQIREADVQKMLRTVNERRQAMDLQEDDLQQRSTAMKEWEENLRIREAALTQRTAIAWQPNGSARESDSDLFSLSSISTVRNSPRRRSNVDPPPRSNAKLKQESRYHGNESVSLASTTRGGPSKHTNIGLSSSKSHARLKQDSEYYGNE